MSILYFCKFPRKLGNRTYMEKRVWQLCSSCGGGRWVRPSDVGRATKCRSCHSRQAGKKGYRATKERYGEGFVIKKLQEYRIKNPSSLEMKVVMILDELGFVYVREFRVFNYLIDFRVELNNGDCFYFDVDGDYVHSKQEAYDCMRHQNLKKQGFEVHRIKESDIHIDYFRNLLC